MNKVTFEVVVILAAFTILAVTTSESRVMVALRKALRGLFRVANVGVGILLGRRKNEGRRYVRIFSHTPFLGRRGDEKERRELPRLTPANQGTEHLGDPHAQHALLLLVQEAARFPD